MAEPALRCEALDAGWGDTQVLSGISFSLPPGEVLAVLGRNGVGKSTLLSTIMGRATRRAGSLTMAGRPLDALPVHARARLGIGLVPQEREIFPSLSVRENLLVARRPGPEKESGWTLERLLDLFPRLGERLDNGGNQLSGGEQQMLSIARALVGNPSLLLLDEPMEGLAPVIIEQLITALHRLRKESNIAILLVEQHVQIALQFTDRVLVLDRGTVVYDHAAGLSRPDVERIAELTGL